jgi:nucleotide-binding universal stress UspA family protein
MTNEVLLTVDGSEKDNRAIAVAAGLVELAGAAGRVLRVFETPVALLASRAAALGAIDGVRDLRARAVREVHEAASRLRVLVRSPVTSVVVDGSDVAATLLGEIASRDTEFVVAATRAAGSVGRAIQGSIADRLVRESSRPVVLVPPRASYLGGKVVELRRVLVPLDGSAASLRVIPYLLALPLARELEFVLLQAVQAERTGGYPMPPGAPGADAGRSDGGQWVHVEAAVAEERLSAVADRLRACGSRAHVVVIESRDPGALILDAIRKDLIELIAMSTRGESGLRRLVLGSVAEQVVRHSEIPVLLVTARSTAPVSPPV